MNDEDFSEECCETDCKELVTNVFGTNAGDFIIHRPFCKKHSQEFERNLKVLDKDKQELWDQRVRNEECLECGKVLTDFDKEYDKDPRKHCASCLEKARYRINKTEERIDKLSKNPLERYGE